MENGTVARATTSSGLQQNPHHYLPILMTNGKSMSGSVFSRLGSESPSKTNGSTSSGKTEPVSAPSTSSSSQAHQHHGTTSVTEPRKEKDFSSINIPAGSKATPAAVATAPESSKSEPNNTSSKASPPAAPALQSSGTASTADPLDGTLSDFDGSDLSDLNSDSSLSGSGKEDHDGDESSADGSGASDHDDEEDRDKKNMESSESDNSLRRSKPVAPPKKSQSKGPARAKNNRRILSDNSSDEEEAQERVVKKRGPGRPPKLKNNNNAAAAAKSQSPKSPNSPAFNATTAKLNGNGSKSTTDMEGVVVSPTTSETQTKRKTKQPDFINIGKRDRSGRTQLFKYTAAGDLEVCKRLIEEGAQVNDRDYADWTPLHEACVTGHDKVAELLIQHHADVNAQGGQLDTPLHDAAQNGHVEVVKLLLAHGANVLAKNAKGITPIDVSDDSEVIELLERRQSLVALLTGKNQAGQTMLHRSCSSGSYNSVADLLSQGADINAKDNAQWTPLHEAALAGHTTVVELLLSQGANPNAKGHGDDTALHDAAQNEHEDVVRLLLEFGADPDFKNSKGEKACDVSEHDGILELLKHGARGTKKPSANVTAGLLSSSSSLSSLASQGSKQSTASQKAKAGRTGKESRRNEGSAEAMSDDGRRRRSPSEDRPVQAQMSRDERKMQQLLSTIRMQEQREERKKAKKRNFKLASDDENDEDEDEETPTPTPTPTPTRSTNPSSWKQPPSSRSSQSTSRAATKTLQNGSKRTTARSEEREESSDSEPTPRRSIKRSLGDRFRIDHRFKDSGGRTQLHKWSETGDIEMVGTLLEGGFDRDPTDNEGLTPLHLAAKAGNTDVLVLLLAYGCNINAQDNTKSTALHEAVRHRHKEAVRLLLQNNAAVGLRDSKKRTSLELVSPKDEEIKELLKTSLEQAELKTKERSKKRLSQVLDSRDSGKHKERKINRRSDSDSDEPIRPKSKEREKKEGEDRTKHIRTSSTLGMKKSASLPSIVTGPSGTTKSTPVTPTTATASSTRPWGNSGDGADVTSKQKGQGRRLSSSSASTLALPGLEDADAKISGSSKKRREGDRPSDGYSGRVKIKKEREEDGQSSFRSSSKTDELRRVVSTPALSKELKATNRHGSRPSLSSRTSSTHMASGSSIATISPPLTETSSSPPPLSSQSSSAAQDLDKSRKRSSQTFASPSGYLKFADDLKLGNAAQHSRQRSTPLAQPARPVAADSMAQATPVEPDSARKKAKTSQSESITDSVAPPVKPTLSTSKASSQVHPKKRSENGSMLLAAAPAKVSSLNSPTTAVSGVKTELNEKTLGRKVEIKKEETPVPVDVKPSERSVQDAQRYLPLYTVQLSGDSGETSNGGSTTTTTGATGSSGQYFCVVDKQVQLLLGLAPGSLFTRYPHLLRRLVTKREKVRLWSPLSSMVSDRCAAAVKLNYEVLPAECQFSSWTNATHAMSRLKEHEKQKFLGCDVFFVRLEEVIEVIKRDYAQLNESMMTIMLDIGYDEAEMEIDRDEETEEEKVQVKEEEMDWASKPVATSSSSSSSSSPPSLIKSPPLAPLNLSEPVKSTSDPLVVQSTTPSTPVSATTPSGPHGLVHKLRRVPAKMATKAMFKEMQQQQLQQFHPQS